MSQEQNKQQNPVKIRVKYDDLNARYASQVILNNSSEEVFLDFSSGILPDQASGESLFPVHTRIVMTHAGARRLLQALNQTLNSQAQSNPNQKADSGVTVKTEPATPTRKSDDQKASLPKL